MESACDKSLNPSSHHVLYSNEHWSLVNPSVYYVIYPNEDQPLCNVTCPQLPHVHDSCPVDCTISKLAGLLLKYENPTPAEPAVELHLPAVSPIKDFSKSLCQQLRLQDLPAKGLCPSDRLVYNPACTDFRPVGEARPADESHTAHSIHALLELPRQDPIYKLCHSRASLHGLFRAKMHAAVGDHSPRPISVVVDSGAAWTALRLREYLILSGSDRTALLPADRRFHGASKEPLRCEGRTMLSLRLGGTTADGHAISVNSVAYVFNDLAEPMLLGANTLRAGGLVIDAKRLALYPSPDGPMPAGAVPLCSPDQAQDSGFHLDRSLPELLFYMPGGVSIPIRCRQKFHPNLDRPEADPVLHGETRLLNSVHRRRSSQECESSAGESEGGLDSTPLVNPDHSRCDMHSGDLVKLHGLRRHALFNDKYAVLHFPVAEHRPPSWHVKVRVEGAGGAQFEVSATLPEANMQLWQSEFVEPIAPSVASEPTPPHCPRPRPSAPQGTEGILLDQKACRDAKKRPQGAKGSLSQVLIGIDCEIAPFSTSKIPVKYTKAIAGPNISLEVSPSPLFQHHYPSLGCRSADGSNQEVCFLNQSCYSVALVSISNHSDAPVTVTSGTPYGYARRYCPHDERQGSEFIGVAEADPLQVNKELEQLDNRRVTDEGVTADAVKDASFEGLESATVRLKVDKGWDSPPQGYFEQKRWLEDKFGIELNESYDCSKPDQPRLKLEDGTLQPLIDALVEYHRVFSRDAKAPVWASHPLTRVSIDTGAASPIRQKPYPIPDKYLEAVRAEIASLVRAGLIEPGISDWCSPVICILKKDSPKGASGTAIKLKVAVDYRKLNAATIIDSGLLGDQADILDSFHKRVHKSLCDMAGGFYQFEIKKEDRHKTCFVLPAACGGTTFVWRVAPYGLTNMPGIYSRAIMHVLSDMHDIDLGPRLNADGSLVEPVQSLGRGDAKSWVDDVVIASGGESPEVGVVGHCNLLRLVFHRLLMAGLTLKGSKAHLLRKELEVLGFIVDRDGIRPNPDKVQAICDFGPRLNSQKEALRFLGMVNFNRRFVQDLGHVASPLFRMLKKGAPVGEAAWDSERAEAFEKVKQAMKDSALQAHPDLRDPFADLVIMTDASDVAAGAVLMQWQKREQSELMPSMEEDETDGFARRYQKRWEAGYRLVILGYYSKSFNQTQRNWAAFDKEAAAVLLAVNHWRKLVIGRNTALYTDNTVAASILTSHKVPRPAKIQRWGVELGTYLPHLHISYRKGTENLIADAISRPPAVKVVNAVPTQPMLAPSEVTDPNDLYDRLITLQLGGKEIELYEHLAHELVDEIWSPPSTEEIPEDDLSEQLTLLCSDLSKDVQDAEEEFNHWKVYMAKFQSVHHRRPVIYDLFCGEGSFGRGAHKAGCDVYGFDRLARPPQYGHRPIRRKDDGRFERELIRNMHYYQCDLSANAPFWDDMIVHGRIGQLPSPDLIHASPPCAPHSQLQNLQVASSGKDPEESLVAPVVSRLRQVRQVFLDEFHRDLPWSVENSENAFKFDTESGLPEDDNVITLCGTMFGRPVFRHRHILSSHPWRLQLDCHHAGKLVGSRGIPPPHSGVRERAPNMYGVYSRYSAQRGTMDELHQAMGFEAGSFSHHGLTQGLPLEYGQSIAYHLTAWALQVEVGTPVVSRRTVDEMGVTPEELLSSRQRRMTNSSLLPWVLFLQRSVKGRLLRRESGIHTLTAENNPWSVSPEQQSSDPQLADILQSLDIFNSLKEVQSDQQVYSRSRVRRATRHAATYVLKGPLLYQLSAFGPKLLVPTSRQDDILHATHTMVDVVGHRSAEKMYDYLKQYYAWYGLYEQCRDYVARCEICSSRRTDGFQQARQHPWEDPPFPFHTIHIDHKHVHTKSEGFKYILIVVDRLSRFTIAIALAELKASETLRALINHCFLIFSFPKVIVSDNGSPFNSELQAELLKYAGIRHIRVLPYLPQANGTAEQGVKRVGDLLAKHTALFQQWHKALPVICFTLNTAIHATLEDTPFYQIFGRQPTTVPVMEFPKLIESTYDGSDFVKGLADNLQRAWASVQATSIDIRSETIQRAEKRKIRFAMESDSCIAGIRVNDWVMLKHGSDENARERKKNGHPFSRSFKVVKLLPKQHALEIDPRDTGILKTVHLSKCRHVPDKENWLVFDDRSVHSGRFEAPMSSAKVMANDASAVGGRMLDDTNQEFYEVDEVQQAVKNKGKWRYLVKYKNYPDPEWVLEKDLTDADDLVQSEMLKCRRDAILQGTR